MGCISQERANSYNFIFARDATDMLVSELGVPFSYCPILPESPINLVLSNITADTIQLDWEVVGSTRIYRKPIGGSYALIDTVTGTSYEDTGLSPGTGYTYRLDNPEIPGIYSNEATAFTLFDFSGYGALEWGYDFTNAATLTTYLIGNEDPTVLGRISAIADISTNGHDITQATQLSQALYLTSPKDGLGTNYALDNPIMGLRQESSANPLYIVGAKSVTNFLHQGTHDFTLYGEFLGTDILKTPNTLIFASTGFFQDTGFDFFIRNNAPNSSESLTLEVRIWNASTNLLMLRTAVESVKTDDFNFYMITFNASTRELRIYINDESYVTDTVTNNFNAGDSDYQLSLTGESGGTGNQIQLGSYICWKGTILTEANFNEIRAIRANYLYIPV